MNKAELAGKVEEVGFSRSQAETAVETVIGAIKTAVSKGKEVKISGLGTFKVVWKKARTGRNPQTGEELRIPRKKKLAFKASKTFTAELNA